MRLVGFDRETVVDNSRETIACANWPITVN